MNGRGVSSAPLAVVDVISSSASTKLIGTPSAAPSADRFEAGRLRSRNARSFACWPIIQGGVG